MNMSNKKKQKNKGEEIEDEVYGDEEEYIEALVKYSLSESDMLASYELKEEDWIKIYKEYQIEECGT